MNNEIFEQILPVLHELFPDSTYEYQREADKDLFSFYIELKKNRYILKITGNCVDDHDIEKIKSHIKDVVFNILKENPNKFITLKANFSCEISEIG